MSEIARESGLKVIAESFAMATVVGALIVWSMFAQPYRSVDCCTEPAGVSKPFWSNFYEMDFARRWDGTCRGWDRTTNLLYVLGDGAIYYAYVMVAWAMIRLHPTPARVPLAGFAVTLAAAIFVTCAFDHLLGAIGHFRPMYRLIGLFKIVEGVTAAVGSVAIVFATAMAFSQLRMYRAKVAAKEVELGLAP